MYVYSYMYSNTTPLLSIAPYGYINNKLDIICAVDLLNVDLIGIKARILVDLHVTIHLL